MTDAAQTPETGYPGLPGANAADGIGAPAVVVSSGAWKVVATGLAVTAGLFEPLRHFLINAGVVAGLLIGGPAIYKMVTRSTFVIKDISVPPALSSRGFTGDVIAQQILDRITEIDREAGSKSDKAEISGFDLDRALPSINLPAVGGFNLAAIVSELRELFGYVDTKVTGEVYVAERQDDIRPRGDDAKIRNEDTKVAVVPQYGLRLRVAGDGPLYRSDQSSADVEPLINQAALEIMHRYDPINLGYYYYRSHDLGRASALTEEMLADPNSPNAPWAYAMRGLIDRDQGNFADAAVNLREAIARAPNFWLGYVHLAGLLRLDHNLDDAEKEARRAIELAPKQQEGHAALALILLDRGQEDAALAEMKTGVDVDPKDPNGHLELGRLQARVKRFEDALKSFRTAAALKPSAEPLLNAADAAHNLKRDGETLKLLLQATRSEPKNAEPWLQLGELRIVRNEVGRGGEALKKAVALDNRQPKTLIRAARDLAEAKHASEAEGLFVQFAPRWPENADVQVAWADTLWSEGRKPDAIAKVHEALNLGSSNPQVFIAVGRLYEAHGQPADAADAYRKASALDERLVEILKPQIDRLAALAVEKPFAAPVSQAAPAAVPHPAIVHERPTAPTAGVIAAGAGLASAQVRPVSAAPQAPPQPQAAVRPVAKAPTNP